MLEKSDLPKPLILFENNDFAVVDKPHGLTVNRSETTKNQKTLQDWIEQELGIKNYELRIDKDSDFYKRSGIVHRLDKDTSGLILVAKNPQAFTNLQEQFKKRLVKKTYLALVWGTLRSSGEINAPITRNPFNRKRFGVFVGGKEAHTYYHVLENKVIDGKEVTLLEINPLTGRTHQIRVHLNYLGHPVVGDLLYSGGKRGKEGQKMFGRLMLHAYKISFVDPGNRQKLEFMSEIPEQFKSM